MLFFLLLRFSFGFFCFMKCHKKGIFSTGAHFILRNFIRVVESNLRWSVAVSLLKIISAADAGIKWNHGSFTNLFLRVDHEYFSQMAHFLFLFKHLLLLFNKLPISKFFLFLLFLHCLKTRPLSLLSSPLPNNFILHLLFCRYACLHKCDWEVRQTAGHVKFCQLYVLFSEFI